MSSALVQRGHLTLTRTLEPVTPTPTGSEHRIGCTLAEVFDQAKTGERVWLDDGTIGMVLAAAGGALVNTGRTLPI